MQPARRFLGLGKLAALSQQHTLKQHLKLRTQEGTMMTWKLA